MRTLFVTCIKKYASNISTRARAMVHFGERLPSLMRRGWEQFYIDYEGLKKMIRGAEIAERDTQSSATSSLALSSAFVARLEDEIRRVDAFVERHSMHLQIAVREAGGSLTALEDASSDLAALRHFVGTNIIAATKIVKKHDKNVQPALHKREHVAAIIRTCRGINGVPAFHRELTAKLGRPSNLPPANQCPGSVGSVAISMNGTGTDTEADTEASLRSLPRWLLSSDPLSVTSATQHDKEPLTEVFLVDWHCDDYKPIRGSVDSDSTDSRHKSEESVSGDDPKAADAWEVDFSSDAAPWSQLSRPERARAVLGICAKLGVIVGALYFFICSLSFLASGFRLVAGRQAGEIFRNSEVFDNPIAGLLVGVLVTVLVQSSSTSTSIVITMVAADLFTVRQAISLIMGANIGTSVTSTIVALAQSSDRAEFRRAFAAATVHDMFNFCSVLVLLPLEAATGYLYRLSGALLPHGLASGEKPPDILKKLTKPFTRAILSIDKNVIKDIAAAKTQEELDALADARIFKKLFGLGPDDLSDGAAGAIVLIGAIAILCSTLFLVVYTLKLLLKGRIAVWLHRSVNGDVPDIQCGGIAIPMGWLSGYLAMGIGLLVTIAVQSSSITTSALTPLVGVGVINIERMYPTVLGANLGTCITGLLAALSADGAKLYLTLRVAFSHLLFNISGILLWYVCWPLRAVPVRAAKFLGNTTADYRWFALVYLALCFFLLPALFMGLALASSAACVVVAVTFVLVGAFVVVVNTLQARHPGALPSKLRSWDFLPLWMTSLAPIDRVVCAPLERICFARRKARGAMAKRTRERTTTAPSRHDLSVAAHRIEAGMPPTRCGP
ncbi:MAG: hypothetical protein CMP83_08425 [Gammaproteobacteria bacterium]|nr:hypothetical protein [Gammaproteobacteria bacterium]